jgi:hypothetical protein
MSTRPDPPDDCEEASEYASGDKVYYYRTGEYRATEDSIRLAVRP